MPIIKFLNDFHSEDNIHLIVNGKEIDDYSNIIINSQELNIKIKKKSFLSQKPSIKEIGIFLKNLGILYDDKEYVPYSIISEFNILVYNQTATIILDVDKDCFCANIEGGMILNSTHQKLISKRNFYRLMAMCIFKLFLSAFAVFVYICTFWANGYAIDSIVAILCGFGIGVFVVLSIVEIVRLICLSVKAFKRTEHDYMCSN